MSRFENSFTEYNTFKVERVIFGDSEEKQQHLVVAF